MKTIWSAILDDLNAGIQLRKLTEPLVKENGKQAEVAASSSEIFNHAETVPSFPGGDAGLYSWLAKNIVYPPMAAEKKVKGRVVVQFVVLSPDFVIASP